ncbi:FAD:protein FMN transferase [Enterovibrio norvegicus]|uniref:FAD:protein FMN transferase n=1 Tax=Enterovibrio norvegicus TaxID=188144 RepID=UPI000C85508A|nr:FAD:protein FMN transferase [Enterovibrio norvegicus]PML77695.1 FAD:protein FMN transferase ApbE [Enterovibrio norvegicus]
MKKFLLSAGLIVSALMVLAGCDQTPKQTHLTGSTMGTYYSVKFLNDVILPSASDIQVEIDRRLELVNDQMSTYRKTSELSQFNQHKDDSPFTVSKDTATVMSEAIRINKLSGGALDVTVGPLVNLWGFGPEGRPDRVPTDAQVAERRAMTGINHLFVDGMSLIKTNPDLYVDLSSIAKGFGVDVIANYLAELGLSNYLVEIGGELQLKGVNAEGQPWRIAIEKPSDDQQTVQEIIAPGDMAMATSGDYRNYFEENGVRYSHTINPATAKPINHRLVSVTVLDKSCMTADGFSTAFMVMGPDKALTLANSEKIAAFFIIKTDNGFKEVASDAFKKYLTR